MMALTSAGPSHFMLNLPMRSLIKYSCGLKQIRDIPLEKDKISFIELIPTTMTLIHPSEYRRVVVSFSSMYVGRDDLKPYLIYEEG